MKNQNGLTLIELLAVLAISSMVVILAVSIFTSMVKVSDKSINHTFLRNESVLIMRQLDDVMMNTDTINMEGVANAQGYFKGFYAINKSSELTTNEKGEDVFDDKEDYKLVKIENNNLELFQCDKNNVDDTITCKESTKKKLNSESYMVTDTLFNLKSSGLHVKLIVLDPETNKKFEVNKLYSLQSE